MRIRTLKPEWLDDQLLNECSDAARVLSAGLILLADDYGRGRAGLGYIAGHVWSSGMEDAKSSRETLAKASGALRELLDIDYAILYEVSGQRYFAIRNWAKHQRVDHPGKPRVPEPLDDTRESLAKVSRKSRESLAPDRDHDHDLNMSESAKPTADKSGSATEVNQIWAHWLEWWRKVRGSGAAPVLNRKRRGMLRARLAEGYSVERLMAAADGCWTRKHNLEGGYLTPELVYRNGGQVELYEGFAAQRSLPTIDPDQGPSIAEVVERARTAKPNPAYDPR